MHTQADFERAIAIEERRQTRAIAHIIDVDPDVFIDAIETGVEHPFWDMPTDGPVMLALVFWCTCHNMRERLAQFHRDLALKGDAFFETTPEQTELWKEMLTPAAE